ncbi:MAG: hypothetical protein UHS49_06320 [Faecalimonas sp.]|nr:hypothetical protein [Faecalimonas sp.]
MADKTFAEQVKEILGRRGMTIKQLAEMVEEYTGKPMSRQNMTQRLGRDNFQEQDMRMIAEILDCKFELRILEEGVVEMPEALPESAEGRDITLEELTDLPEKVVEPAAKEPMTYEAKTAETEEKRLLRKGIGGYFQKVSKKPEEPVGEINPYTGKEYKTNSVRMHPKRIGYVQVYDQEKHQWTDMTEWAFLGYQERQKALLGKDYQPPTYLD